MLLKNRTTAQIDRAAVERYFNGGAAGTAATVSMMAHEHCLPDSASRYRRRRELRTIVDWVGPIGGSGHMLDVGCGAGAWAEIFARRYRSVVGIEQSPLMVTAARKRLAHLPNVEAVQGDGRRDIPDGRFDTVFLGGLCMYLDDADVVVLVNRLKERLSEGGSIILRESTVRHGVALAKGEYEAVYRSVNAYRQLLDGGGPFSVEVRPNYGYASMITAEALVDLRRRWLPFFPKESAILGVLTWWALRGTTPLSLWAMPRVLSRLNIPWPSLQNHFFRLQRVDHGLPRWADDTTNTSAGVARDQRPPCGDTRSTRRCRRVAYRGPRVVAWKGYAVSDEGDVLTTVRESHSTMTTCL